MRAFYGRSRSGDRATCSTTAVRSKNFSVIACMGIDSVYHFNIYDGPINGETFRNYLADLIAFIRSDSSEPAYIIMDNASIHRTAAVVEACSSQGSEIRQMLLPPYSPQLNPIEHLFSQWKNKVRSRSPKNEQELSQCIHQASTEITEENCSNYYCKMEANIFKLLAGQSLDD